MNSNESTQPDAAVAATVEQLIKARLELRKIPPPSASIGDRGTVDLGYEIQDAMAKGLKTALGARRGWKIAMATPVDHKQFGITEPIRGPLFDKQEAADGAVLRSDQFLNFHLEAEVAVTIKRDITEEVPSVEALNDCIASFHAGFDIADLYYRSDAGEPTIMDIIACGAGAARFIIGPPIDPGDVDIDALSLRMTVDGQERYAGSVSILPDGPRGMVRWLANHLLRRGQRLREGDIVLTGKVAPAFRPSPDQIRARYVADCGVLGTVSCSVE